MKSLKNHLIAILLLFLSVQSGIASLESDLDHKNPAEVSAILPGTISDFGITGPEELCLYYGSIIGEFFGGGLASDVFRWKIVRTDGSVLIEREGGFQSFSYTFSEQGEFEIQLTIRRGVEEVYSGTKNIIINKGADLVIQNSYLLCNDGTATLTLLDPNTPKLSSYQIKWYDGKGQIVGTGNSIQVNKEDKYSVEFFTLNEIGGQVCPFSITTYVYKPKEYQLSISTDQVCEGSQSTIVSAGNSVFGSWFFQKEGTDEKVFLGNGNKWQIVGGRDLQGPGLYKIIFEVDNSASEYCKTEDFVNFTVNQHSNFNISFEKGSENCGSNDGILEIVALTDLDILRVRRDGIVFATFRNLTEGEVIKIPGLSPGLYAASGALNGCSRSKGAILPLTNPPSNLEYTVKEVVGETCDISGKIDGQIYIKMLEANFSGTYRLLTTTGGVVKKGDLIDVEEFSILAPAGNYFVEISEATGCVNPKTERIVIGSKPQVSYSIPDRLNVCGYFDLTPTTNQNLSFTLTYPDNSKVTKTKDEAFRIDQSGEYILLGFESDSQGGLCPKETTLFVTVSNPIEYQPELISRDCFGNKQYVANLFGADPSRFNITWFNEKNEIVGTEEFLFPTSFGEFKLEVQPKNSEACPTPPKSFIIDREILEVELSLQSTALCPGGISEITLSTDQESVETISWLYIDLLGNLSVLEQFENETRISVSSPGNYEAVVFNDLSCEIGRALVSIKESENLAFFEVPEQLVVCETFELIPITDLDLKFTVINPDGTSNTFGKGENFLISENGEYSITGESADSNIALCTVTKKIQVVKNASVDFEPEIFEQNCEGKLVYSANLFGKPTAEVDIFWYNEVGELVGTEEFLSPQSFGIFELEVRPKGSFACPEPNKKEFEISKPILALEGKLVSSPYCPDTESVSITLEANLSPSIIINWFFTDFNGNRISLVNFLNQNEIVVSQEGTYEVEMRNHLGCLLGSDLILLMKSMDENRPQVEENYIICPSLGNVVSINPGSFLKYEWFLNGVLVNDQPTFSPSEKGSYKLTVTSFEGCLFTTSFEVKEECVFQVRHTTGMSTKDVSRPFKVYSNSLVDQIEVYIFNNWGQMVFHCTKQNFDAGMDSCEWNGEFNGQSIQPGNYSVKIIYKNNFENISKSIISSVTVVD
ncbi:gliding motility-associated C-terminal domain-containing protein [Aquiflexum gelatinilyticum]|uniref:gliding motility-associated C-terminal domain-containing protein n=1 Tax=Aquiflexum gelatinilyticum TaxID=2961943 RepID=UPI002168DC41|nr:gliding motility-associated C-terminal domain-containing protein [Aquiflexum gelatinilyticum]MCS4436550.1 gliding motility-associated C-terminal domain-containing protein [Aquiflexum gelatinilyticum]